MHYGEQIRTARELAGLSQSELGRQIGVSLRTIGNWERGATIPQSSNARLRYALRDTWPGDDVAAIGPDDDTILFSLPRDALEGLSDLEIDEIQATARAKALQAVREIKGSR